jgi:peptidoglycan/xylan/chitin deacetylase (PgdA/CDA1 family)
MRRRTLLALLATLPLPLPALARTRSDGLIEPELRIAPGGAASPRVALTLDACMGEVDLRILDALVGNQISATIFVTRRWLDKNGEALVTLKAHPELFELRIRQLGYRIAGFSLNADFGASIPAAKVAERLATAKDGDVIIGHINQPKRSSGEGIVTGILALKQRGFRFVRLSEVDELGAWGEAG